MNKKLLLASILTTFALQATHNHEALINSPIGVHGDHVHRAGSFMLGLSYMNMNMDGNIQGSSDVTTAEVNAEGYGLVPETMSMQMKMLHAMYSVTDSIAVMAMLPYSDNEMLMSNAVTMTSQGLGDVGMGITYQAFKSKTQEILVTTSLNLPTGSLDTLVPGSTTTLAPYPMQLGSGSYALLPSATYLFKQSSFVLGTQAQATFYLNENERAYTLGNVYMTQAWIAYAPLTGLSLSSRIQYNANENITGQDVNIPLGTPTGDPQSQAYQNILNYYGVGYAFHSGFLKGHSFGVEYGIALYQNSEKIHMKWDNALAVSWEMIY